MTLTANEQYFLELVNRARLDPLAEAARYGIDLNESLPAGTLNGSAKQVLAPNAALDLAAELHSAWMLQADVFSHTGSGGSDPGQRMTAAGYAFTGSWTWGENIAWTGTTGTINLGSAIDAHHRGLFLSHGHRENLLNNGFKEVGIAQVAGQFTANGTTYNASMATQDFARSGTASFLTGVVYADSNHDGFYSIGEGRSGSSFAVGGVSDVSEAAGGYALAASGASYGVTVTQGAKVSTLKVLGAGNSNIKLDLVDGLKFLSSGSLQLLTGVANAGLLGVADLTLNGNGAANRLVGNAGANRIDGGGGSDDVQGGAGADMLIGLAGNDRLEGGIGNDRMSGGAGADMFRFIDLSATDVVVDFTIAQGDRLELDNALWNNLNKTAAGVVAQFASQSGTVVTFNFGGGDILRLINFTDLAGLAGQIDFV